MSSGVKEATTSSRVSVPRSVKKTIMSIKEITGQTRSEDEIYTMLKECSMDPNETAQKLLLLDTFHEVKRKRDRRKEIYGYGEVLGFEGFEKKMSSGIKEAAASSRVSVPRSVKKTIMSIKEIIGQTRSEDEIYTMLKECSMDPNETAQKLLLLDTFHEVKRKRDRRKENAIKEPAESRWKPASQARANRGGRGNYSSRHGAHDAGGGRNSSSVSGSSGSHVSVKLVSKNPVATTPDVEKNEASIIARLVTDISDGPSGVSWQSINSISENHASATGSVDQSNETGLGSVANLEGPLTFLSSVGSIKNLDDLATRDMQQKEMLDRSNSAISLSSAPVLPSPDPALLPSPNFPFPSSGGTPRNEVESKHTPVEIISDNPTDRKLDSFLQQKMQNEFQGVEETEYFELLRTASSVGRPSSNYNNQSQVVGPQKGSDKVWKPKSTSPSGDQGANVAASSEVSTMSVGSHPELQHIPSEKATPELQRKLEELHISNSQHVIIPNHLHVPEAGNLGFCFGSFYASFGLDMTHNGSIGRDNSLPLSESSDSTKEPVKENTEVKHPDHVQSPSQEPEHFSSSKVDALSSAIPEYVETRQEVAAGSHQHSFADTSSNYNYGFIPFESPESQACDFQGGASVVLSTASPVPLVTQAVGVLQSSITTTQQVLPVFRQPTGIYLPHYPPFIPYGPYYSPLYFPSLSIHQFLSNGAFPQQTQGGSLYPNPPETPARYSVSQHKQGSNTGSSTHVGLPGHFGFYSLPVDNYNSGSATAAVTKMSNEDHAAPQVKETDTYVNAQQSEGYTQTQPGCGTFTGLFDPAQAVTAAEMNPLLQLSQAITNPADMVGPTSCVHQQQQEHKQLN